MARAVADRRRGRRYRDFESGDVVFRIDVTEQAASALVASIAAHLPAGESLGRLIAVTENQVLAGYGDGGRCVWGADDAGAWRLITLPTGLHEVVTWYHGVEETRRIVHEQP